jgi:hypothetical protein
MAAPVPEWYLSSERTPAYVGVEPEWSDWVEIVVVRRFTDRWISVGRYHYPSQQWHDQHGDIYNVTPWVWVTHWLPLPELPPPVSKESILVLVGQEEPDFVSDEMPMRILLQAVDPADQALQDRYRNEVWRTGSQGTRIYTRGKLKGNRYYIDFYADDAVHLRRIKEVLDGLDAAYTITSRK